MLTWSAGLYPYLITWGIRFYKRFWLTRNTGPIATGIEHGIRMEIEIGGEMRFVYG